MHPKLSLLDELRRGGYESSLITTFNAYLPFYEEVVLRRLMSAGVRHNVLMMDSQQYAASLGSHPPRLAGRRYTLLPVDVPGAFHPKLIFLVGKSKGLVAIGSHNMTLSGFGFNRELTNVVTIKGANDSAGIAVARDVWKEVELWLEIASKHVPGQVVDMVLRVKESAPWLDTESVPDEAIKVIAGRPGGKPLWEQFTQLTSGSATDILLSGAFFDEQLKFIERIKQNLKPNHLVIGVDPKSVQISNKARSLLDVSLVNASTLAAEKPAQEKGTGYLHAKAIFVRQTDGETIFASGSANPSTPAWLATDTTGNVELMLVRRGESAVLAAEETGFLGLLEMPVLDDNDWTAIHENHTKNKVSEPPGYASGIAVVEDGAVHIQMALLDHLVDPEFVLLNEQGQEVDRSKRVHVGGNHALIEFPPDKLTTAVMLECFISDQLVLKLLLHHSRAIEEQARTGVQRKFKEALLSLNSGSPNFALLLECLDKMLFSDERNASAPLLREAGARDQSETEDNLDPGSLAIDVKDIKKRKSKRRLLHTGDLAYLLDTLIYHLKYHEEKAIEELDRFGRNEEEQVDSDDEDDSVAARELVDEQNQLLALCHSKVHTVVNRMLAQFAAYTAGKQPLANVIVRLLGVLAVLRELRSCDGRSTWVEKGQTAVPEEERVRLLNTVMLTLFEGKTSLLNLDPLGEEFAQSDDVARLKGLVLWLAWDCGLTLDLRKPFMEDIEDRRQRLLENAMVLALAQLIRNDDVVIDEARQSIGSLSTSEMEWLKDVEKLASQCESLQSGREGLRDAVHAEPGDIAIHKTVKNWTLRIVDSSDEERISLIKLVDSDDDLIPFKADHVLVGKLS